MHAHHRVGGVILEKVGEKVAQVVAQVAVLEAVQDAARRRNAGDVGDGELAHLVLDHGDEPGRRHPRVDHEVEGAPPRRVRAFAPAEDRDAALHERAVGDEDRLPVAGLEQRGAPADVAHPAGQLVVDPDPVAHLDRVVELDRESAKHVAQRVLHGEGDDRGEDRRGGHQAAEVHPGAAQLREPVDDVGDHDGKVLDDARGALARERQQQAK